MVPNKCAEITDTDCVRYTGAGIFVENVAGDQLVINQGTSLEQIIQQLVLLFSDPGCVYANSACQATTHVYPYAVGNSSIAIAWMYSPTAVNYQVEYRPANISTWSTLPVQSPSSPLTAVISPLFSNTWYLVRVNSFCSAGNCYSVILQIKTN
jgi:hypothetical protein